MKTRYQSQIADLARYADPTPIKKAVFSSRTLRNGWKAAGLHPWNPSKAITLSQVVQQFENKQDKQDVHGISQKMADLAPMDSLSTLRTHRKMYDSFLNKTAKSIAEAIAIHATVNLIIEDHSDQKA